MRQFPVGLLPMVLLMWKVQVANQQTMIISSNTYATSVRHNLSNRNRQSASQEGRRSGSELRDEMANVPVHFGLQLFGHSFITVGLRVQCPHFSQSLHSTR